VKQEIEQKANLLNISLMHKESEFKTLKQENEQNLIKINTLNRTQEDEKSKASALKANEIKLNQQIESLNTKIESLNDANQNLKVETEKLQEGLQNSDHNNR